MPIVYSDVGEIAALTGFVTQISGATLRLFQNDFTPTVSNAHTASNYTESNFTGYSAIALDQGWGSVTTDGDGKASVSYSQEVEYAIGSSQTCYGYYVTDTSGDVLFSERFDTHKDFVDGETFSMTPTLSFRSENG